MKSIKFLMISMLILVFFSACKKDEPNEQNKDPKTYDEGVVINGIKWATRNVDAQGTFATSIESFGRYYTFATAKTVCPNGWRLPTKSEIESLLQISNEWTSVNGVLGRKFTSDGKTLFLPASGANGENIGIYGCFWSSTSYDTDGIYILAIENDFVGLDPEGTTDLFSVRCVAEK